MNSVLPRDWKDFVAWCNNRGLKSLPAHPWTVAAYVRWCEPRKRLPLIVGSLKAITRMHLLKCRKTPGSNAAVLKILRQIEVRALNKDTRAALFRAEDFAQAFQDDDAKSSTNPSQSTSPRPLPRLPQVASSSTQQKEQRPKRITRSSPRLVRRDAT